MKPTNWQQFSKEPSPVLSFASLSILKFVLPVRAFLFARCGREGMVNEFQVIRKCWVDKLLLFFYALFKYSNVQLSSVSSNSINIELSQFCSWRRKKIHKKDLFNVDVVSPRQQ